MIIQIFILQRYLYNFYLQILLINLRSNNVKNLGHRAYSEYHLTIWHCNLNGIATHNVRKVTLLKAYISLHKADFSSISEYYFDSPILSDDTYLQIMDYSSFRINHLSSKKTSGCFEII